MKRPLFLIACLSAVFALSGCPSGGSSSGSSTDTPDTPENGNGGGGEETPDAPPAAPFDQSTLRGPWKHAKVGDYAVYNETFQSAKVMRYEVTKIEGSTVTISFVQLKDDKPVGDPDTLDVDMGEADAKYQKPDEYDSLTEPVSTKEHTLKSGKTLTVSVIKRKGAGSEIETWLADDDVLPFHNNSVVRSTRDGSLNLDLLDFGSK